MKTHEEWIVLVKHRVDDGWWNARMWYPGVKNFKDQYCKSEDEAKAVLNHAYKLWNGKKTYNSKGERYETQKCGMIGVDLVCTKDEDKRLELVEYKIRKRTVTEWETVEKNAVEELQ